MGIERLRYSLTYRLRALLRPTEVERDLDDEMRYHVERETAYALPAANLQRRRARVRSVSLAESSSTKNTSAT